MKYVEFVESPEASLEDQISAACMALKQLTMFDPDKLLSIQENYQATFDFYDWWLMHSALENLKKNFVQGPVIRVRKLDRMDRRDLEEAQDFLAACIRLRKQQSHQAVSMGCSYRDE